ncbi:MAG: hypothetical protein A2V45_05100 [Candidatus Aminicenantes bacterium RBG_19FT_COMBO_58_17]|nr:MAG: hypothetical protein A2V45_05100 [Candidatus Aminicenantes bacterium RBG_19FT_COMBO_58_17]
MKVLLVNKYFFLKGGAEAVFFETARVLKAKGHSLCFFSMHHPQNFPSSHSRYFVSQVDFIGSPSWPHQLKAAGRILYSLEAGRRLSALIRSEKPDLAHLHNIHHQISPSILPVLKKNKVPVVMTLHDYKLLCPVYTFYSQGAVCERCAGGRYFHCLLHKCSKDSYLKSAWNTLEMSLHNTLLDLYGAVDVFICPSRFLQQKMTRQVEASRLVYLPNFISLSAPPRNPLQPDKNIVYCGRLSKEKGLRTLLRALRGLDARCQVIGQGPDQPYLEEFARRNALHNVTFLGHKPPEEVKAHIRDALFTVLPSEWYENHSRAVVESFSLGRAVVASRIGSIPELVKDGETGLTFSPGNAEDLRAKMLELMRRPGRALEMGVNARRFVQEQLEAEVLYPALMNIYGQALEMDR